MKITLKKILSLSTISSILLLTGCSSHEIIGSSNTHFYNENFGLVQNEAVDTRIQEEIWAQNKPTEIELPLFSDPTWTTELAWESNAVTAENYVQAPPVFTYKYKYDPKFYADATWRSNDN